MNPADALPNDIDQLKQEVLDQRARAKHFRTLYYRGRGRGRGGPWVPRGQSQQAGTPPANTAAEAAPPAADAAVPQNN